ncbi:hypothetical protein JC794_16095 [Morganella morganii]|uniref:hypothetical protein n=1 Tax=Morganella morganii TaxID=582 RepID=UPI001C458758|nr:hypothetical protein [Morganella morganii]QXO45617.1 hypothetical protein JC862_14910 [Morganella morganii]QXO53137.1 hypothetical protein JC830_15745 [Morganella morganii]QXO57013.1 hypothetical protein JC827_16115 [Morganella morganii]QXO75971.1 hypothetical protein JC794_16095 [Morganella morganii]QXO79779.1 hypothetical protein JA116_15375 [Morganella morganii]
MTSKCEWHDYAGCLQEDEISTLDATVKSEKLISDLLKEIIIEAKKELKIDG